MPHAVFDGPVDLAAWAGSFRPLLVRRGADVLRADRTFLASDRTSVLVEALAVEAGRRQPFYVKVSTHGRGGAAVRIDPMTHPDCSEGVREIVARIGADLLQRTPGLCLNVTNLVLPSAPREGGEP